MTRDQKKDIHNNAGELIGMTFTRNEEGDDGPQIAERAVRVEKLTEDAQHQLAEELARASPTYHARMQEKFTHEELTAIDPRLARKAASKVLEVVNRGVNEPGGLDHMWDDTTEGPVDVEAAAVRDPIDPAAEASRRRAAADAKYNEVMQLGGNSDEAQRAADRVWRSGNNF